MKKLKFIAIMACTLIFASCSSTDSLIEQLEKACKNKDAKEMAEIIKKLDKKDLTKEQELKYNEIILNCALDIEKNLEDFEDSDDEDFDE
jgi:3-keto-L-gulonate-6-phosphate decarboxylase